MLGLFELKWYVYILKCVDGYYTGCTDDVTERVEHHVKGYVTATKDRRPVELVNVFGFRERHTAFQFEKYLKSGSGRAFVKKHFIS